MDLIPKVKQEELALNMSYFRPGTMSDDEWDEVLIMQKRMEDALRLATKTNDLDAQISQDAVLLHRRWLIYFLPEGTYSYQGHKDMVRSYLDDPRMLAMYDKIEPGAAQFLDKALNYYCLD